MYCDPIIAAGARVAHDLFLTTEPDAYTALARKDEGGSAIRSPTPHDIAINLASGNAHVLAVENLCPLWKTCGRRRFLGIVGAEKGSSEEDDYARREHAATGWPSPTGPALTSVIMGVCKSSGILDALTVADLYLDAVVLSTHSRPRSSHFRWPKPDSRLL